MKQRWTIILLVNFLTLSVVASDLAKKCVAEDYSFILVMPNFNPHVNNGEHDGADYVCAIFALEELKVCRFPNGSVWSNSLAGQKMHPLTKETYLALKEHAQKLDMLCLDYADFRLHCQNDCNQSICGFALPWETGMAYVFDDLKNIDQIVGFIVEKKQLSLFFKNHDCIRSNACEEVDFSLDEIDLLLDNNQEEKYIARSLPYPLERLKVIFGKIAIACLMSYYELKQKITNLLSVYHARPKT